MRYIGTEIRVAAHHGIHDADAVGVRGLVLKGPTVKRDQRLIAGTVTTDAVDHDEDVVLAGGIDQSYFPGRVKSVYLDHQYYVPHDVAAIGVCRRLTTTKDGHGLYAQTRVTDRPIGDAILTAVAEGALGGLSIGFMPIDASSPTSEERKAYPSAKRVVRESMLLEYSLTSMPCNPDALIELVSKDRISRFEAVRLGLRDSVVRRYHPTCVVLDPDSGFTAWIEPSG